MLLLEAIIASIPVLPGILYMKDGPKTPANYSFVK